MSTNLTFLLKLGGHFEAEYGGHFAPELGGQFAAELGGQFVRILQVKVVTIFFILFFCLYAYSGGFSAALFSVCYSAKA